MEPTEAYEVICAAVEADPTKQLVESGLDKRHFGNFFVSFESDGQHQCWINDRGFLFLTNDAGGKGQSIATLPSLRDLNRETLLRALSS